LCLNSPSWLTGYHHTAEGAIGLGPPVMLFIHSFIHASQLTSATLQYHTPLYVAHCTWCGTTVLSRKHSEALVNADCNTYRASPILRGQAVQPYKRPPCSSSTPVQVLHTESGAPRGVADKHCANFLQSEGRLLL